MVKMVFRFCRGARELVVCVVFSRRFLSKSGYICERETGEIRTCRYSFVATLYKLLRYIM